MNFKKITAIIMALALMFGIIYVAGTAYSARNLSDKDMIPTKKPLAEKTDEIISRIKYDSELAEKDVFNILLLGIDRRSKAESAFRTDTMILLSVNKTQNTAVLTSIPRDLWYNGGRINATYITSGWEGLEDAIFEISGMKPDRFILTDFEDFSWIVDAMGGVPVEVETTFTDSTYPIDATKGIQTVSFTKGFEQMTGERALIFSRSRKGDFDNGDWGRMKRQHLLLKGMLTAVQQPQSLFNPMVVEEAYKTVTENRMDTNLQVSDAKYLWDFYQDYEDYKITSLYLDQSYLYTPPLSEYGGAWVLVPEGGYGAFKQDLNNALNNIQENPTPELTDNVQ